MAKKMIWGEVTSDSPSWLDGTLGEALKRIQYYINKYGSDARIDYNGDFYYPYESSPSPKISILIHREETDAEYAKRTAYEAKWQAEQAERDRVQYERLKKQFEGK